MTGNRCRRPGAAAIYAVVVLAVLSGVAGTAAWQISSTRRSLDMAANRVQAEWLARGGAELAADRLRDKPDDYTGEVASPVPGSGVRVRVTKDPDKPDTYRVESEARFPASGKGMVVRMVTRTVKRVGPRVEVAEAR